MKLALAPIPFYWSKEDVLTFYTRIADAPVDIVYLGETVCYKRRGLRLHDWIDIGKMLVAHGKEVILSSLVLIDGEAELKATQRLCANGHFFVEANDMGAVALLNGLPFVAGATLNIYNEDSLEIIKNAGASRFVAPLELSGEALARLTDYSKASIECEILAFGRPTLAYSARCFTARSYNHGKDECALLCQKHAEGIKVATQEDTPFLIINGLQICGATPINYITEIESLGAAHVDILRVVPDLAGTITVIEVFRGFLDQRYDLDEAKRILSLVTGGPSANGYWRGRAGQMFYS